MGWQLPWPARTIDPMAGNYHHRAVITLAGVVSATTASLAALIAGSRLPSLHWLFIGLLCVLLMLLIIEMLALSLVITDWARDRNSPLHAWVDWARDLIDRRPYIRSRSAIPMQRREPQISMQDGYHENDWRLAPSVGSPVPISAAPALADRYEPNGPVAYRYEPAPYDYGDDSSEPGPVVDNPVIQHPGSTLQDAILSPIAGIVVAAANLARVAQILSGRSAPIQPFDRYAPVSQDENW